MIYTDYSILCTTVNIWSLLKLGIDQWDDMELTYLPSTVPHHMKFLRVRQSYIV